MSSTQTYSFNDWFGVLANTDDTLEEVNKIMNG